VNKLPKVKKENVSSIREKAAMQNEPKPQTVGYQMNYKEAV